MISLINHDSSEGEQWGRYNLPRFMDEFPSKTSIEIGFPSHLWLRASHSAAPRSRLNPRAVIPCISRSQHAAENTYHTNHTHTSMLVTTSYPTQSNLMIQTLLKTKQFAGSIPQNPIVNLRSCQLFWGAGEITGRQGTPTFADSHKDVSTWASTAPLGYRFQFGCSRIYNWTILHINEGFSRNILYELWF
jgi:hypothetical protein